MEKEERINNLKRHIFYELLAGAGRVMILVRYSPDVIIGKRGFVGDEVETGITLALNPQMKFSWDDYGITAVLAFGASSQKCFIPAGSIAAVYSPELKTQFFAPVDEKNNHKISSGRGATSKEAAPDTAKGGHDSGNVINVDFVHKKRMNDEDNGQEDA
jgi:hypothetical protein